MSRAAGILLLCVFAPLALFVLSEPPSWSGAAYALVPVVLAASLVVPRRLRRRVAVGGVALLVVPALVRIAATKRAGDVRVVDRLIDERDLAVNGSRVIGWTHFAADPDVPLLPSAMRSSYDDMAREQGSLPSPFVATYLGLERPGASDTLAFERDGDAAVVVLHGYAGNFTMSCWLFARAVTRAGMTAVCPSTRWVGDWWMEDGEAIVRETIASLRARGKTRIFLAGLSNGAIGASLLAPRLRDLAGLLLVSGASPSANGAGIPTLVIQGRSDRQIPAPIVRAYAMRAGAEYVELDAGHFVLLVDRDRAAAAIGAWLHDHS